jgi:hypothetical protein
MTTQKPTTPIPSRRAAIAAGLGGALALAVAPAAATPAPLTAADSRALQLWRRLRTVKAIYERRYAAWSAAHDQLPAWARGGPKYVNRDGSPAADDEMTGWPMVADPGSRPVAPNEMINVRPTPHDLAREWQRAAGRRDSTYTFVRAALELGNRVLELDAEEDRLGLLDLSDDMEDASRVK